MDHGASAGKTPHHLSPRDFRSGLAGPHVDLAVKVDADRSWIFSPVVLYGENPAVGKGAEGFSQSEVVPKPIAEIGSRASQRGNPTGDDFRKSSGDASGSRPGLDPPAEGLFERPIVIQ